MVSVLPRTTDSDPFKPRMLQFSLRAIDSFRRSKNDIQTAELWVIEQKGRVHDPVPCFRVACMPTLHMLLPTSPKGNCAHVLSTQKAKTDSPNLMLKLLFLTPIRVTNQCDPLWSPDQPSLSLSFAVTPHWILLSPTSAWQKPTQSSNVTVSSHPSSLTVSRSDFLCPGLKSSLLP